MSIYDNWCTEDLIAELEKKNDFLASANEALSQSQHWVWSDFKSPLEFREHYQSELSALREQAMARQLSAERWEWFCSHLEEFSISPPLCEGEGLPAIPSKLWLRNDSRPYGSPNGAVDESIIQARAKLAT